MDLGERLEVCEALLHNIEGRIRTILPAMGMRERADKLRRIGNEFIQRADELVRRINDDTDNVIELSKDRLRVLTEIEVIRSCIRRGITDYSVVVNAMAQIERERKKGK